MVGAAGRCAWQWPWNGRNDDDKSAEKKQLRKAYFDYDEAWRTGSSHKAKRQEEKTLKRMPLVHVTVLFDDPVAKEKPDAHERVHQVIATATGGRSRVGEEKCEPQQFNDNWALILLQMRAFLVPTTEGTKNTACVYMWECHSFHYIGSACSWRRGHEKLGGIGQKWLEHVGLVRRMRCGDRCEGEKLRYRLARRENSRARCAKPGDSSDTAIEAVCKRGG